MPAGCWVARAVSSLKAHSDGAGRIYLAALRCARTCVGLPAVPAAAEIAASAPATTAATPATPATTAAAARAALTRHRASLINDQGASHEIATVARLDRTLRRSIITDFHKPKSTGLTTEAIPNYVHTVHGHASRTKKTLQVCLGGRIGKISHE